MIFFKLKRLSVSHSFLGLFLTSGEKHYKVIENALPDDVRVINITSDPTGFPLFWFILHSESWPMLEEGDEIPMVDSPIMEKL